MLDLRDLECLLALTRHKHFARAAEQVGVSQPAFSMRIKHLEDRLDTQIVKRGNRYIGLTSDGEMIVERARSIVDGVRALEEEVRAARGEIVGSLKIGAIPTAAAYAGFVANWLRQSHPGIRARIETGTSLEVQQGVEAGRFDAGLTYTEGTSEDLMRVEDVYLESYVLFVPEGMVRKGRKRIGWARAAELPLILLEPGMQNRRIVDRVFEDLGAEPEVVAETSGFVAAMVMAAQGMGAAVIPRVILESLGEISGARMLPLVDPVVEKSVSLITRRRPQGMPVVEALRRVLLTGS